MALTDLLERLERRTDTPDTPCNPIGVSAKPAWIKACTPDTPDTPEIINGEIETPETDSRTNAVTSYRWLLHFADREPVEVFTHPDADFARMMREYPDCVAAEPLAGERYGEGYPPQCTDTEGAA